MFVTEFSIENEYQEDVAFGPWALRSGVGSLVDSSKPPWIQRGSTDWSGSNQLLEQFTYGTVNAKAPISDNLIQIRFYPLILTSLDLWSRDVDLRHLYSSSIQDRLIAYVVWSARRSQFKHIDQRSSNCHEFCLRGSDSVLLSWLII